MIKQRAVVQVVGMLACATLIWFLRPQNIEGHYGFWSLLPAVLTIVTCFLTRNVLLALLFGVFTGGLVSGKLNILNAFLIPSLGSENYAQMLLVYLWALGSLLGLWNRNGGARHFAEKLAERFVNSRTSAKVFTWCIGVLFHQGGTISTVLTGTTVKPITDKHAVAHEELAYVVDSTASPIATIIPFNVWPIYIAGLITIEPLNSIIGSEEDAIKMFLYAIPFNFYAWIAVSMTLLFALGRLPLLGSPMAKVVTRVTTTGELDDVGAQPMAASELTESNLPAGYNPSVIDFLLPILVLLGFCIVPLASGANPLVF
jgi:Na+/H+ antiporter NhaC